ncbi:MAG: hypothetical protein K5790_03575 [Nitrosopumilus sp.]|uniref:hypothetical protein n=1 Tax=Nitrosopumilus sp. TaxID=2024843 RepID=UPI00247BF531|nr:hypothetical protein [Nitrosopumilus sp.]MCV0392359.1 hypothetical protein [Nitrosopumilus sp.]
MHKSNPLDKEEESIQSKFGFDNRVLLLIAGLAILFEFYVLYVEFDTSIFNIADSFFFIGPIGAMTLGFSIAAKSGKDSMYFKPFMALSVGILFFMLGDVTYLYYDVVLGEDPYPSIGDLFYWLFYPFVIGFIVYALKFFAFPLSKPKVTLISIITAGLILAYTGISYDVFEGDIFNFDFAYGMIFVSSAAFTVGLATLGIISFKNSLQGLVWALILASLLINAVGDIWYYHLELFEGYEPLDTIDTLYLTTWMVIFYGLYRHYRYSL